MLIEVLGPGCKRCLETEQNVRTAVRLAGATADVVHVTDVRAIAERRVLRTPAVAIDGVVKLSGTVPSVPDCVQLLINHLAASEAGGSVNLASGKGTDS